MAAIVPSLIPILRTAVETTTDYQGRTLWFGFLVIRLVTLYFSELPWSKVDPDFECQGNVSSFCRKDCFNQHFDVPIVMLWNFACILFLITVLLMELFASHLRNYLTEPHAKQKQKPKGEATVFLPSGEGEDNSSKDTSTNRRIDFHKEKLLLYLYLACILFRLIFEIIFLMILIFWHLPKVDGAPISCNTDRCPGPFPCIVRASREKQMGVYGLIIISGSIIGTNFLFILYSCYSYCIRRTPHPGPP